ncbi:Zonadhesin [Liparis tanakae]|uniref:Zonadhesin n=1 Tax=Liparis tanakae TaxID=230148 RepID=A0A4Z2FI15_9TELE|nr:Zonadhesin [Liparis tanakae]
MYRSTGTGPQVLVHRYRSTGTGPHGLTGTGPQGLTGTGPQVPVHTAAQVPVHRYRSTGVLSRKRGHVVILRSVKMKSMKMRRIKMKSMKMRRIKMKSMKMRSLSNQWNPNIDQGNPNRDQGNPNIDRGNPNIDQGNPNIDWGNPNIDRGNPNIDQGNPNIDWGNPNIDKGNPNIDRGNPNIDQGNPNIDRGNPNIDRGNPNIDQGNPNIDQGNPDIDQGNPDIDQGNPDIDQGNPDIDQGNPDIDRGNPNIDRGNPNIDQGNPNIDQGNPNIDQGNPDIDQGNPDIDRGNPNIDQGNPDIDQGNPNINQGNPDIDQGNLDLDAHPSDGNRRFFGGSSGGSWHVTLSGGRGPRLPQSRASIRALGSPPSGSPRSNSWSRFTEEPQRKSPRPCSSSSSSSSGQGLSRKAVARKVSSSKSDPSVFLCVSANTWRSAAGEMWVPRTVRSSSRGLRAPPWSRLSSPLRAESSKASQSKSPFRGPMSFCSSVQSSGELERRGALAPPLLEPDFLLCPSLPRTTGQDPSMMRVPVLVAAGRLLELPEEPVGLGGDAQAALSARRAAGAPGPRLEGQTEPALQRRVDLDRRHPPLLVGAAQEALGVLRVDPPEASFPRLVLLPRNLDEALVEGQVVSDGVLRTETSGVGVSVVAEVVGDPVVDAGQRRLAALAALAALHRHADERRVRVRRLDARVGFVVHLVGAVPVRHDARQALHPAVGRRRGLPRGQGPADGGGVRGQRGGRRVGARRPVLAEQVRLVVRARRHVGAEDGELLQPLQAGEAVVQGHGAAEAIVVVDVVVVVVVVVVVPLLRLRGRGHHLLLQPHGALRPRVGAAQRQHGSVSPLLLRLLPPDGTGDSTGGTTGDSTGDSTGGTTGDSTGGTTGDSTGETPGRPPAASTCA